VNIDVSKLELRPGQVAVQFVDDDGEGSSLREEADAHAAKGETEIANALYAAAEAKERAAASQPTSSVDYEGCLAQVEAVGPKVSGLKVGDIVVTTPYARSGLKIGAATLVSAEYDIVGRLKS
jgi:hypothetical protein